MDYNRDGEIHFHGDPNDPKAGTDDIPPGKYYEFWVNNDRDGAEDDLIGLELFPSGIPANLRDLEDYARLWIHLTPQYHIGHGQEMKMQYRMYREPLNPSEESPALVAYRAVESNGGLGYLKDEQTGRNQLQYGPFWKINWNADIPANLFLSFDERNNAHMIFCAVAKGRSNVVFEVVRSGIVLARYKVPMDFREIRDFYDEYYVGDPNDDPDQTTIPLDYSVDHKSTAESPQGTNYILYVPGWNMGGVWHKERWAETAYKRLWWLGYKGHFGMFRWPSRDIEFLNLRRGYNESEYNAWRSGTGLLRLLQQLKGEGYSVDVLAHSQGNVVMAEALREAKDGNLPSPLVNAYVATQAALSSSLFDSNAVDYFTSNGRNLLPHLTPIDALAHFPAQNPFGDTSLPPYMAGTKKYATNRINFYNPVDYAVGDNTLFISSTLYGTQSAWEVNNTEHRPWQALGADPLYSFNSEPDKRFFFQLKHIGPNQWQEYDLDPSIRDDRFKILAFAAQSYGRAVGAGPVTSYFDKAAKSNLNPNFNLAGDPTFLGQGHYEHDAEFMYNIQLRWPYWQKLMTDLGMSPAPWTRP